MVDGCAEFESELNGVLLSAGDKPRLSREGSEFVVRPNGSIQAGSVTGEAARGPAGGSETIGSSPAACAGGSGGRPPATCGSGDGGLDRGGMVAYTLLAKNLQLFRTFEGSAKGIN